MKKRIQYSNEDMGNFKIIKDFLPHPDQLIFKDKNIRITINIKKSSIDFFKNVAKSNKTKYQKVIRNLLDIYANNAHTEQRRPNSV